MLNKLNKNHINNEREINKIPRLYIFYHWYYNFQMKYLLFLGSKPIFQK